MASLQGLTAEPDRNVACVGRGYKAREHLPAEDTETRRQPPAGFGCAVQWMAVHLHDFLGIAAGRNKRECAGWAAEHVDQIVYPLLIQSGL